jgi:polyhydroxyalkanoate synthesis regulator phasin
MSANKIIKRLMDAGMQFTEMSQDQAERLVREFVKQGQTRRKDAEALVAELVERGRLGTEQFAAAVQAEVARQFGRVASRLDELEAQVAELAGKLGVPMKKAPAKKAPAKKA